MQERLVSRLEEAAEISQRYCGEVRQMLTFLVSLHCSNLIVGLSHSVRFVEHMEKYHYRHT
jgi:hypothetical protein